MTKKSRPDREYRGAPVRFEILSGADVLATGCEAAARLWNSLVYAGVVYNSKVQRWREGMITIPHPDKCPGPEHNLKPWQSDAVIGMRVRQSLAGRLPPYPGKYDLQKEMRADYAMLADRCFSYTISEFDAALRAFFSKVKSGMRAAPPRYCRGENGAPPRRSLTFEIGRNAKHLGQGVFRLTVLGGHIENRHAIVRLCGIRPGVRVRDIRIMRLNHDGSGSVSYVIGNGKHTRPPGNGIAAIDVGIINVACIVFDSGDSLLYTGRGVLSHDYRYNRRIDRCKPAGYTGNGDNRQGSSRRKKRYNAKRTNVRRLAVHRMTRSIVNECAKRGVGTIVMGDLRGIRQNSEGGEARDFGKRGNRRFHQWAFAEIAEQIKRKAREVGIEVVTISEEGTSQTCSACGRRSKSARVRRGLYRCAGCGLTINADLNGAVNIFNKYIESVTAATTVSPGPQGLGVRGDLPAPPSPETGIGEVLSRSQIEPRFVARYDLRTWEIAQTPTGCADCGFLLKKRQAA